MAESLVHNWVRQAKIDAGDGPGGALTTVEKEELDYVTPAGYEKASRTAIATS